MYGTYNAFFWTNQGVYLLIAYESKKNLNVQQNQHENKERWQLWNQLRIYIITPKSFWNKWFFLYLPPTFSHFVPISRICQEENYHNPIVAHELLLVLLADFSIRVSIVISNTINKYYSKLPIESFYLYHSSVSIIAFHKVLFITSFF